MNNKEICKWIKEEMIESEIYNTACKNSFIISEGDLPQNDMKYCCFCGKLIKDGELKNE